jgi:hypothetical protein
VNDKFGSEADNNSLAAIWMRCAMHQSADFDLCLCENFFSTNDGESDLIDD